MPRLLPHPFPQPFHLYLSWYLKTCNHWREIGIRHLVPMRYCCQLPSEPGEPSDFPPSNPDVTGFQDYGCLKATFH
ncbi:hypothetical protein CGRA01v4_03055 [Colletotrichum graminicola]|nr:hypothetical protein CGRA01v4_03055 [Colletotrichum graminicola]